MSKREQLKKYTYSSGVKGISLMLVLLTPLFYGKGVDKI